MALIRSPAAGLKASKQMDVDEDEALTDKILLENETNDTSIDISLKKTSKMIKQPKKQRSKIVETIESDQEMEAN